MNPTLNPIFERRSIRRFTEQSVDDAAIDDLLHAAMAAPSAVARDPWHFVVVRDAGMRNRMADALPNGQMLRHAPAGILVCGDLVRAHGGELSYLLQDCSAAVENLLLAASMLELGACWLGVHPRPERIATMRALFRLPDPVLPVAVVAVGYPAEEKEARTRFRAGAVHRERW